MCACNEFIICGDGSIDVDGNINIIHKDITALPFKVQCSQWVLQLS
jgi:hypothetical protein